MAVELLGGRVAEVKIHAKTVRGRGRRRGLAIDAYSRRDRRTPMRPFALACTVAAGNAAEHLFGHVAQELFSPGDVQDLIDGGMCGQDIKLLDCLMQRWLATPAIKRAVNAVARALLKKNLTGADVRAAIGKKEMNMSGNWISGAIKNKGSLRKTLGAKAGKPIAAKKLNAAAKKPGVTGQRARLAKTLKGLGR